MRVAYAHVSTYTTVLVCSVSADKGPRTAPAGGWLPRDCRPRRWSGWAPPCNARRIAESAHARDEQEARTPCAQVRAYHFAIVVLVEVFVVMVLGWTRQTRQIERVPHRLAHVNNTRL
jgi:hypothetical protein